MGQRLNIEIMHGDEVLANAYYHWSAYTPSALRLTKGILMAVDTIQCGDVFEQAVRLLEATGAGVNTIERNRINQCTGRIAELAYQDCVDRNEGLLAVTEQGIEETRCWEEGRVTIHLDTRTVDFSVFWDYDPASYEADYEEPATALPLVSAFETKDIPFDGFARFMWDIEAHPAGLRTPDGTVYRWIE